MEGGGHGREVGEGGGMHAGETVTEGAVRIHLECIFVLKILTEV